MKERSWQIAQCNKNLSQKQVQLTNSNQITSQNSKRYDKNGDEIIWEMQKYPIYKLILQYLFSMVCIYLLYAFLCGFLIAIT